MKLLLCIDFGSTFTKLTAIDIQSEAIIGSSKSFTTIETDVMQGFHIALSELYKQCGNVEFDKKLASSSAAGGLKMIAVGLVPDLTAKAARLAASSAGAKVLKTYAYELTGTEQHEITAIKPDIILLSGGIDGGNKEVILHNADVLSQTAGDFAVIIAGNRTVAGNAEEILKKAGKDVIVCKNVMPVFNKLDIMPAKHAIRDVFIKNIISAKGLDAAQAFMSEEIIPTPLAVFEAAELLSRGTKTAEGIGELMAYDVGGATTDVYSMASGMPTRPNVYMQGMNEPFAKRTVEGDIGMRYSISSLLDASILDDFCESYGFTQDAVTAWEEICKKDPSTVPGAESSNKNIDEALAAEAVRISAARHVGYTEAAFTPMGELHMQTGKDLTGIKTVIGSGGSVIHSREPAKILRKSAYHPGDLNLLKPLNPRFLVDYKNCFAAMGLAGRMVPDVAIAIMKKEFVPTT